MESCVKAQYHKSEWFPVRQGTRQGGVLSPFLYLVYDNDLIWELEESKMGMYVHGIYCGSPAVADDKLVLSFSKQGISPVENQNDLELDFKAFFFVDSGCWGIKLDKSNWCHSVIIERFEIFKMASKMAVS